LQGPPARSIPPVTTALASIQWLFFMFANIVVIPLSIGYAFHQPPAVITASLERAFIYTGIACILQGTIGHRLPLMEGSAGLWWGVILSLAASAQASGQSLAVLGGTLEVGIILTGLIIILLGVTGLGWWLRLLFTPVVTSTFYFLLGAQLCAIFFKGMLGLSTSTHIEQGDALLDMRAGVALEHLWAGIDQQFRHPDRYHRRLDRIRAALSRPRGLADSCW
jgi:xanthine/uracil permease